MENELDDKQSTIEISGSCFWDISGLNGNNKMLKWHTLETANHMKDMIQYK